MMTHWNHFKQVLRIPNPLGMQRDPFPPVLSDVLALSPSEVTRFHPAHVPTQGCIPSPPTGALQRHFLQGCRSVIPPVFLVQHRHRKNKEEKWLKIVPIRTKFSVAEVSDTENAPFLGQAPEAVTPGQTLISTCIAVNPHPSNLQNRFSAARFQLLQKLIDTTKAFSWLWVAVSTGNLGLNSFPSHTPLHTHSLQLLSAFQTQV